MTGSGPGPKPGAGAGNGGISVDGRLLHLSTALLIEREVRQQRDARSLAYYLVNETARLHQHSLAFFMRPKARGWSVISATDVHNVEDASGLGDWLRKVAKRKTDDDVTPFETAALAPPADLASGLPPYCMLMVLKHPDGGVAGKLLLLRDTPFQDRDRLIAEPMAECYGHAIASLDDRPFLRRFGSRKGKKWLIAVVVLLCAAGFIPVPITALAPVEIVARQPTPITAPFDGIIADVLVRPYEAVTPGQMVVRMDQTELAMEQNVASRSLAVTEAELERYRHEAYLMPESKAKMAIWELKVELSKQELANARDKLERHRITAPVAGVAVYDHRFNWRGQPVKAGQRLMTIAQPNDLEAQIELPAGALIPLANGAPVTLFLDIDPTRPIAAKLTSIGYQAQPTAAGTMAYRYRADIDGTLNTDLLGARGTARLEGDKILLAYALLRRPIAALRQFVGL
ncbi:efflux RND transporter periplasmic adaptor subunit [Thalassospira marina]|uniref:Membrane fusion protein biotin-lipoyl like domain-containing protein n=1 Tax=Thalassospira marina TaxID=2048283 RepID=A0ABM6Q5D4_9PROT|nr:HlyD family efflux transporter periplasmic adaptor subunit [Thalassospira marina]AUG51723.1 hypothetical protein CSC3H3_02605 [Thalassospira marina]